MSLDFCIEPEFSPTQEITWVSMAVTFCASHTCRGSFHFSQGKIPGLFQMNSRSEELFQILGIQQKL